MCFSSAEDLTVATSNSQQYQDYLSFVESLEDLLIDYYNLVIDRTGDSSSSPSSCCKIVAKDTNETLSIDITLILKASVDYLSKKHEIYVVVNGKEFASYFDAIVEVDSIIEDAMEKLTRKEK